MSEEIDRLLARGLKEGFAGGTVMQSVKRGGFNLKSSHFESEGGVYHDEWFAERAGGGQEIVNVGNTTFTRVYAGGTIPLEELKGLGISKRDVMAFLKKQMTENDERNKPLRPKRPEFLLSLTGSLFFNILCYHFSINFTNTLY